ncbi:glycoside hydrolase family 9 protein, partial [Pseudomonas sp. 2995-3]|uniref:glycoside hydrolase family 9 protein n=1 Tax=Pseudomonas sp. 2995-3 TaxID=1712680 RepID=UPI0015B0EC52
EFPRNEDIYRDLREGLLNEAENLARNSQSDGYFLSLKEKDYIWGSNMLVMNNAMLLLLATQFSEKKEWHAIALDHVHYLLGRNAVDIS